MSRILAIGILLMLPVVPAFGANFWLDPMDPPTIPPGSAPPATPEDVPMQMDVQVGDTLWYYIWGRPDEGQTLLNLSLNAVSSDESAIWFTDATVVNPRLAEASPPFVPNPIDRYEFPSTPFFVGDPDPDDDTTKGVKVTNIGGATVANQEITGAGMGPNVADFDPTYDPQNDAWLIGSIHLMPKKPGHYDIFLQIGQNGLNNAGQSSSDTNVVFGALTDPGLNGNADRQQNSETPEATIWVIPEPSSIVLMGLGLLGLIALRRRSA